MNTDPPKGAENPAPEADQTRFQHLIEAATGTPFRPGNHLTILQNGDQIFPAMLSAIRNAETSIEFVTYVYWNSRIAGKFADALADAARRGVTVRLLVDAIGGAIMNSRHVWQLERAGVKVAWFRPVRWRELHKLNSRTHRKILLVDGNLGFVGGVGIADFWTGNASSPKNWRETHCSITGPACADLHASFAENWREATGEKLSVKVVKMEGSSSNKSNSVQDTKPTEDARPRPSDQGGASHSHELVKVHTESSTAGPRPTIAEKVFYGVIAASTHRLWITTAYFVPNRHLTTTLIEAATLGVDVRILTNGPGSNHRVTQRAGRASYQRLLDAGVKIYEYNGTVLHTKVVTADGAWATIGSVNLDDRSLILNDELNISFTDPKLIADLDHHFETDLARSRHIMSHTWSTRRWHHRLAESSANLFRHQL